MKYQLWNVTEDIYSNNGLNLKALHDIGLVSCLALTLASLKQVSSDVQPDQMGIDVQFKGVVAPDYLLK